MTRDTRPAILLVLLGDSLSISIVAVSAVSVMFSADRGSQRRLGHLFRQRRDAIAATDHRVRRTVVVAVGGRRVTTVDRRQHRRGRRLE